MPARASEQVAKREVMNRTNVTGIPLASRPSELRRYGIGADTSMASFRLLTHHVLRT